MVKKLSVAIVFFIVALLVFLFLQVKTYELLVRNNSQLLVESVRVFGAAVEGDHVLFNLAPGQEQSLVLELKTQGALKYEVRQGLTRVDSFIVNDVAELKSFHQQLSIEPGNRFLLADLP